MGKCTFPGPVTSSSQIKEGTCSDHLALTAVITDLRVKLTAAAVTYTDLLYVTCEGKGGVGRLRMRSYYSLNS